MECYATHLGHCSDEPSREHYISESVLELAGRSVLISGFPWQGRNQQMNVGINSLTAKILCKKHNAELSPLDDVGKAFLFALKSSYNAAIQGSVFTNQIFKIEGDKLELWLLKVLCGTAIATKAIDIPNTWIEILFQRRAFPEDWGLHFFSSTGRVAWKFNLIRVLSVLDQQGKIGGAKFGIGGLATVLAFGKPNFEEPGIESLYRPASLLIEKDEGLKRFEFSWGNHEGLGSLTMRFESIVDEQNLNVRPLVKPYRK